MRDILFHNIKAKFGWGYQLRQTKLDFSPVVRNRRCYTVYNESSIHHTITFRLPSEEMAMEEMRTIERKQNFVKKFMRVE